MERAFLAGIPVVKETDPKMNRNKPTDKLRKICWIAIYNMGGTRCQDLQTSE